MSHFEKKNRKMQIIFILIRQFLTCIFVKPTTFWLLGFIAYHCANNNNNNNMAN